MLRKLLKYDLKAVWKTWLWLAAAALLVAIPGGFCFRFLNSTMGESSAFFLLQLSAVLGVLACMLVIVGFLVVTEILVFWRFYVNFFSDEGYLTFTLPVSRAQLLLSKTLNACIWLLSGFAVITVSVLEIVLIVQPSAVGELFKGLGTLITLGGFWSVLWFLELILIALAGMWLSVSIIQLCITIGSIVAKKHKILASIGIYYLVNMVLGFASQIFTVVGLFSAVGAIDTVLSHVSEAEAPFFATLILLAAAVIVATIAYFIHTITLGKLERKLNLA